MLYRRSSRWDARRLALLAVVLAQLVASGAAASLGVLADEHHTGLPAHVESPEDADCPEAHNHLFCQAVQSVSQQVSAPLARTPVVPPRLVVVSPAGPADGGHAGLEFLVGAMIPRGPPLG